MVVKVKEVGETPRLSNPLRTPSIFFSPNANVSAPSFTAGKAAICTAYVVQIRSEANRELAMEGGEAVLVVGLAKATQHNLKLGRVIISAEFDVCVGGRGEG